MVAALGVPSVQSRCQRSVVGAVSWGTHFGRGPYHPFAMGLPSSLDITSMPFPRRLRSWWCSLTSGLGGHVLFVVVLVRTRG